MTKTIAALFLVLFSALPMARAAELRTNAVYMADAPNWLTPGRVNQVVEHIQSVLEWSIRRVNVYWYKDQAEFEKLHGFGPSVLAISRKNDNTVHLGPKVTRENFNGVFGHEMVHIISFQKYKEAIPKWLEEGLANYLNKRGQVDYKWLAEHEMPADVHDLTHPFNGADDHIRYHYMASQALAEMVAKKCDLSNLLRLSVGRNMDNYIDTYCRIKDLTAEFKKWVNAHK